MAFDLGLPTTGHHSLLDHLPTPLTPVPTAAGLHLSALQPGPRALIAALVSG
ncbi:hypothetical protein [Nonomuraea sp. CA-141351]|uniref:hypothetical protein n=1 Tax=Nonomuraea sp. CA-141351 TaxID=3239996 RepID=UPI003D8EBD70